MRNFVYLILLSIIPSKFIQAQSGSNPPSTYKEKLLAELNKVSNTSAPSYFSNESGDTTSPFYLKRDYLDLREKIYRPVVIARLKKQGRPEFPAQLTIIRTKTVTLPAPGFTQYFANRIFNGDFKWLRNETAEQEEMGPEGYKTQAQLYHINPYFADLYIMYVFLSDKHYGENQLHPTVQMRIDRTTTVTQGGFTLDVIPHEGKPFWIDIKLQEYYKTLFNQGVLTNTLMRNEYNFEPRLRLLGDELDNFFQKYTAKSPEVTQLFENMLRYYTGKKSIQEENKEISSQSYDDRFFPASFYEAYSQNYAEYPGESIRKEWAGKIITRKEVSTLALDKLTELARETGIAEKDVTKAMFEGRFNPDPLDLELAYEGLLTHLRVSDVNPGTLEYLKRNGTMKANDTLPNENYLAAEYAVRRNKLWNERFGAMQDLTNITTIIHHQSYTRNGHDFILRLLMTFSIGTFEQSYGVPRNAELNYDEALKLAETAVNAGDRAAPMQRRGPRN